MLVDRELKKLSKDFPDIEVEKIDILANPAKAWKNGIRMIPALKDGDRVLSGFLPNKDEIRDFLEKTI